MRRSRTSSGQEVPLTSDYTFNLGVNWAKPMSNGLEFVVRSDLHSIGDTYWGPGDPAGFGLLGLEPDRARSRQRRRRCASACRATIGRRSSGRRTCSTRNTTTSSRTRSSGRRCRSAGASSTRRTSSQRLARRKRAHFGRSAPASFWSEVAGSERRYAAITMPKPSILFLTPSMRAQCQRPCGVDDTTGTPIALLERHDDVERAQAAARHHERVGFAGRRMRVDAELVQDLGRAAAFGNALEAQALRRHDLEAVLGEENSRAAP